jgi:hypothetical protein
MKPHLIFTGTIAALALTACETTGDPTQGGLFGWSEGKAKQRQVALHDAVALEHDRGSAARSQTGRLQAESRSNAGEIRQQRGELNRMLSQLDEVDRAGGSGKTSSLRSRITETRGSSDISDGEVRSLDSEVRSLRSEYGLLKSRR